jgi:hypothetical protein
MTKTDLLQSTTAVDVIKSAKPPAPRPQREYAEFDTFVENADKLVAFFKGVDNLTDRLELEVGSNGMP